MRRRDCLFTFGAATLVGVTQSGSALAGSGRVVVVVARDHPLDSVSLGLLRRIFLAQAVDAGGVRIVPFNAPPLSAERVVFDRRVLGFSPEEAARHWVDQRIRGNPGPPRVIAGVRLLKQVLVRVAGAIGYLDSEDLDESVKALPVAGYEWTHEDYPIR
jgi:hypothetical protein